MSDLNFLLRRMNQHAIEHEAERLEDAVTLTLVGLLSVITLAVLL